MVNDFIANNYTANCIDLLTIKNLLSFLLLIAGATAVVQVEDTKLISKSSDNKEEEEIEIMTQPIDGQDIRYKINYFSHISFGFKPYIYLFPLICRPIGCDIKKGSLILKSYTSISSIEMGLLAACGCKQVTVNKLPSVGILSTGDELQEAGEFLKPGHVYDSNRITLITLLKENGFYPLDFGIAVDE